MLGTAEMAVEMEDEMERDWVAVDACLLPTVERPLRLAEFDGLFAGHLTAVDAVGDAEARILLEGPVGLREMVQDLADRESDCCPFFTFTVSAVGAEQGREVVGLDVEVPQSRADVLAALVARAQDRAGSA